MSRENVEVVRRIYAEGWFDRDPQRIANELSTPDVEFVNPPDAVEPGIRRGRTEIARALRHSSEVFDSRRHELHELFDCGDTVVAAVSFHARGRGSDTELVHDEVHSWTLRDGMIVRFEWGRDLAQALEAAGLRE